MLLCPGCLYALVAPFAGAWIEITLTASASKRLLVAPFAGAWIEIDVVVPGVLVRIVAPFAGAWIEICYPIKLACFRHRRTLRGCVD